MMYFLSNLVSEDLEYKTEEILERNWIDINQIKNMKSEEFRSYPVVERIIENLEKQNLFNLEMLVNLPKI